MFELYIPGIKTHKMNYDESKEKISKKLKELLEKNQIKYGESIFEDILKMEKNIRNNEQNSGIEGVEEKIIDQIDLREKDEEIK